MKMKDKIEKTKSTVCKLDIYLYLVYLKYYELCR